MNRRLLFFESRSSMLPKKCKSRHGDSGLVGKGTLERVDGPDDALIVSGRPICYCGQRIGDPWPLKSGHEYFDGALLEPRAQCRHDGFRTGWRTTRD